MHVRELCCPADLSDGCSTAGKESGGPDGAHRLSKEGVDMTTTQHPHVTDDAGGHGPAAAYHSSTRSSSVPATGR